MRKRTSNPETVPETCWSKRSHLAMGAILINFVAVPFLVVMLAVDGAFLLFWNKSEQCSRMCDIIERYQMQSGGKRSVSSQKIDNKWGKLSRDWLTGTAIEAPQINQFMDNSCTVTTTNSYSSQSEPKEVTNLVKPSLLKYFFKDRLSLFEPNDRIITKKDSDKTTTSSTLNLTKPFLHFLSSNHRIPKFVFDNWLNIHNKLEKKSVKNKYINVSYTSLKTNIGNVKNSNIETTKMSANKSTCKKPSIFAILLEHLYVDDEKEEIIKCTAVILSNQWILTGRRCLDHGQLERFSVRVGSSDWSLGGVVINVNKAMYYKQVVALKLEKELPNECFKAIKIVKSELWKEEKVITFWWNKNFDKSLKDRKKFGEIREVEMINGFFTKCDGLISPVIDVNTNVLIGLQENGQLIFEIKNLEDRNWLEGLL